jgi:hypothetical protein
MISFESNGKIQLCDGWSRREFLRVGGLGALGLTLADWFRAEKAGAVSNGKAKSVILIFNSGAPSHVDLWDMKPNAPDDVRGPFKPVKTNVPGIEISELMPYVAKHADKFAIVRSVYHDNVNHNPGQYNILTGMRYPRDSVQVQQEPNDFPGMGSLVSYLAHRKGHNSPVPPYVLLPKPSRDQVYITPGQFGGFLGKAHDPFVVGDDPNRSDFRVRDLGPAAGTTVGRIHGRRSLLKTLDNVMRAVDRNPDVRGIDEMQERVLTLMTSTQVREAFDLSQESAKLRDKYGRHTWGQSHLLARRLIERGARFVTTLNGEAINWDTHGENFTRLRNHLVPPAQKAFAALLEDLEERGLLEETLVVWLGEFGRSPRIGKVGPTFVSPDGRDHWPSCFSVVMAGGGVKGGQVIGESDNIAAYPIARPVKTEDVTATIFHAIGYDPYTEEYPSPEGRPLRISYGDPVMELF